MALLVEYNSYLKPVTNGDLQLMYTWRNKLDIRKFMFNDNKIEWKSHVNWFNSFRDDGKNDIRIFIENSKPRGVVQINKIDANHQTAEWGFYIGDGYKSGLGTLLAYHALNYIFEELNIRKLSAQVLSSNEKSLRFHNKIGFVHEGILQKQIIRDQKFIDVHLYALFNQDWKHNKIKLMEDYS